jgi:hypothetical protein
VQAETAINPSASRRRRDRINKISAPLAKFGQALASFHAHPTTETFREVQLAGRMLDDVRQTVVANGQDPGR